MTPSELADELEKDTIREPYDLMGQKRSGLLVEAAGALRQLEEITKERDEARTLLREANEDGIAECHHHPPCDDALRPVPRDEWCAPCDILARIAAHLGER